MALPSIAGFDGLTDDVLAALRERLDASGFRASVVEQLDGLATAAPGAARVMLVRARLRTRTERPLRFALLFVYGGAIARDEADALLGAETTDALLAAGVLVPHKSVAVRCPFRVTPFEKLWLFADGSLGEPDSVMPFGPTTAVLAGVLPAKCSGSLLDVGCGPGSLALVAASRGAGPVVGTDVNERALGFARFNARLHGLPAEFLAGDALAPVRGRRFDTIVSQPPFIMRPEGVEEIAFLHGGARGDRVLLDILRGGAEALTPKGELVILSDVALRKDEPLGRYLQEQLASSGLDLIAFNMIGISPENHAILYARHDTADIGPRYVEEVNRYLTHVEREDIATFRHVLFSGRRAAPDARELVITPILVRELAPLTPEVRDRLWRSVEIAREPDGDLVRRRLKVAPGAEWLSLRDAPEGEQRQHRVRFGPAWPGQEQILTDESVMLASLLQRCDSVTEAVAGYAELCEAQPAEVQAPLLAYIRQSLLQCMLVSEENGHGG